VNDESSSGQEDKEEEDGLYKLLCCFKKPHNKRSTVTAFENEAPPSPKVN